MISIIFFLLLRKCVHPYKYMDEKKFNVTSLPENKDFIAI